MAGVTTGVAVASPDNPHYQRPDDDGEGCPHCGYNNCVCDIMEAEPDRWTCPACGRGPSNAAAHAADCWFAVRSGARRECVCYRAGFAAGYGQGRDDEANDLPMMSGTEPAP